MQNENLSSSFEDHRYEKLEIIFNVENEKDFEKRLHEVENEYWGWYLISVEEVVEGDDYDY